MSQPTAQEQEGEGLKPLKKWPAEELLTAAEGLAGIGQEEAVRTQLYKILSSFKRLQREFLQQRAFDRDRVRFLEVELAWTASKHGKLRDVCNAVMDKISLVQDERDFERLVRFIEAIVAFNAFGKRRQPQAGRTRR